MVCLPSEDRAGFLKGLLKGPPDEVLAEAVEGFANGIRERDPEAEGIVKYPPARAHHLLSQE